MDKKLHFVVTSERGKTRSFAVSKSKLKSTVSLSALLFLLLTFASVAGIDSSYEMFSLRSKVATLEKDLKRTNDLNASIIKQAALREHEQKVQLNTALTELYQRSQIIESILTTIGVDVEVNESTQNMGGPFTSLDDDSIENLTFKVDHYLETLQAVPLGTPVPGTITSRFGRRIDPINSRVAFHSGVDIKNDRGTRIVAPADGKVVSQGHTRGYGNFVEIDHGNNFRTRYLHMQKSLVKRGDILKRGEPIGLLGNTGRSTGPHLHYEIKYKDKNINPIKFMRIAKYISPDPEQ